MPSYSQINASIFIFFLIVDTKNSVGLVGCIEEVSHNAICVYWNPMESSAKVRLFLDYKMSIGFIENDKMILIAFMVII